MLTLVPDFTPMGILEKEAKERKVAETKKKQAAEAKESEKSDT